jgi:hypothetical protein
VAWQEIDRQLRLKIGEDGAVRWSDLRDLNNLRRPTATILDVDPQNLGIGVPSFDVSFYPGLATVY